MPYSKRRVRGVASIEFVLGFMAFWIMCMVWVEMSYMSYISAVSDLIVSESAREAKTEESEYRSSFRSAISRHQSIWGNIIDPNKFTMSIQYLDSVNRLGLWIEPCEVPNDKVINECGGPEKNKPIAVYRIDYRFSSVFSYFLDAESIFSREVIVIQEYERDAFEI